MTTLPAWARRLLTKELRFVAEGMEFDREAAQKIVALLAPRKKNEKQKATDKRKKGGAQAALAVRAERRRQCSTRAGNKCEAGPWRDGLIHGFPGIMDHWEGGSGRRKARESVATCWMLCVWCNADRTESKPDAAHWNAVRKAFCQRYGYPFVAHVEHAQLPGRAAR
jgi:hypothetical protein